MGWQGIDDWMQERGLTERARPLEPYEHTAPGVKGFGGFEKRRRDQQSPTVADRPNPYGAGVATVPRPGRSTRRRGIDGREVAAMYERGATVREIAREFDVRTVSIVYHLKRQPVEYPRRSA